MKVAVRVTLNLSPQELNAFGWATGAIPDRPQIRAWGDELIRYALHKMNIRFAKAATQGNPYQVPRAERAPIEQQVLPFAVDKPDERQQ